MPFEKPEARTLFLILGFFLAGIVTTNLHGNERQKNTENPQIQTKEDSSAIKEIRKLVQMQVKAEETSTKFPEKDYLEMACKLAQKTGNLEFLTTHLDNIGNKERHSGHFSAALSLYKKGLEISKQIKDSNLITHFYDNIGVTYRKIDDYQNSLKYTMEAIRFNTLLNDSLGLAISMNNMGNTQIQLHEYNDALKSFKKSIKLEQNRKNKIGLAINLNNIGSVYHVQKQYSRAINYYNLSLEINKRINSKKGIAICYNDLASVYQDKKDFQKSLKYSRQGLAISKKINYTIGQGTSYLDMGVCYFKMHQNKRSIENIKKGIRLMEPLGIKAYLEFAYRTLYRISLEDKNYKNAVTYLKLAQGYYDKLLNINVQNNIERLQIEYKTRQKENQIALLNQKAKLVEVSVKKQSYLIYFLLSAFLLMVIVLAFVIVSLHRRRQNNRLLKQKNKEIEEARNALQINEKELIKAKDEAEKNALAKSQIMADLSHEIRTPLNSVIGFSDLLYKSLEDEKQKKYLQAIGASGKGLLSLINEILDSTKYNKDDLPPELSDFDLKQCVQEVSNIFALKAEEKNIDLKTHFSEGLPQVIHFNKMLLQQILLNLVGNAIKFTEAGYVEILVSAKQGNGNGLIDLSIEIKDTGIGIDPAEQKKIFKPFHQGVNGEKHEGTGLGLSITKNLVKKVNGTIRLISQVNKGSRFIVVFKDVRASQRATSSELISSFLKNIQKPPFLFLNQSDPISQVVKRLFEAFDFTPLDVGINLMEARKYFADSYLIVLCCLGQDELNNTLSILENENLRNNHKFLIITKNHDVTIKGTEKTILHVSKNKDEFSKKISEFLRSYQEEMLEQILFEPVSEDEDHSKKENAFKQIFRNEFKEACSTRMLDNIDQLAESLIREGKNFDLSNLIVFAKTLNQNITHFDTPAIDKQLGILEKAFIRTFNFE